MVSENDEDSNDTSHKELEKSYETQLDVSQSGVNLTEQDIFKTKFILLII